MVAEGSSAALAGNGVRVEVKCLGKVSLLRVLAAGASLPLSSHSSGAGHAAAVSSATPQSNRALVLSSAGPGF